MELNKLLEEIFKENSLIQGVISNGSGDIKKIDLLPVLIKDIYKIQLAYVKKTNTTQENLSLEDTKETLLEIFKEFKQGVFFTKDGDYQVLISKKGKVKIIKKKPSKKPKENLTHNREKNYILKEGTHYPFLSMVGITDEDGKVFHKKYSKFKQINKYLEIIASSLKEIVEEKKTIRIVDFGSGKSYLTFALYWYLVDHLKLNAEIVGLDLKVDVINECNIIADKLKYGNLSFKIGSISNFDEFDAVDVIITLHACNTATDDAIIKGLMWGAKLIMVVPCCQQEILPQLSNKDLPGVFKYGTIKERMASLMTDSIRGNLLEVMGYNVDIFEFIETEHTPKNIIIRGYKGSNTTNLNKKSYNDFLELKNQFGLEPHLEKELIKHFPVFKKLYNN